MRIIPRFIRPTTLIRRRIMRGGLKSNNDFVRLVELAIIGRPALVRATAMRQGFVRHDNFWRVVAFGFLANDLRRRLLVKEPDRLGTERLVAGETVIISALPKSKRKAS